MVAAMDAQDEQQSSKRKRGQAPAGQCDFFETFPQLSRRGRDAQIAGGYGPMQLDDQLVARVHQGQVVFVAPVAGFLAGAERATWPGLVEPIRQEQGTRGAHVFGPHKQIEI